MVDGAKNELKQSTIEPGIGFDVFVKRLLPRNGFCVVNYIPNYDTSSALDVIDFVLRERL